MKLGSMADVPKELADQIKRLEDLFVVSQDKLKEITERFKNELIKGTFLTLIGSFPKAKVCQALRRRVVRL